MVGAIVLAGWAALPWGHFGHGPVPASLEAVEAIGVSRDTLDFITDEYFQLDNSRPARLLVGAELRPAVRAALSTSIMYYGERYDAAEMPLLQVKLRDALLKGKATRGGDAHGTLLHWSGLIRAQFNTANLRLTSRAGDTGTAQLVHAVQQLARVVGDFSSQLNAVKEDMSILRIELSGAQGVQAAVESGVQGAAAGVSGSSAAAQSIPPAMTLPATTPLAALVAGNSTPSTSTTDQLAAEFYMNAMASGGTVDHRGYSSQDKAKAKLVITWFISLMATQEERDLLLPPPRGQTRQLDPAGQHRIVAKLHSLVMARLQKAFVDGGQPVPASMQKRLFELKVGALEGRLRDMKNHVHVVVDRDLFQGFRAEHEAAVASAAAGQLDTHKRQRTGEPESGSGGGSGPGSGGGSGSGGGGGGMLAFLQRSK